MQVLTLQITKKHKTEKSNFVSFNSGVYHEGKFFINSFFSLSLFFLRGGVE